MSSACQWCVGGKCRGSVIGRIGPGLTVDGSAVLDDARKLPDHQQLTIFAEAGSTVVVNLDSRPDRGVDSRGMDGRAGGADGAGEAASLARTVEHRETWAESLREHGEYLVAFGKAPATKKQRDRIVADFFRSTDVPTIEDATPRHIEEYVRIRRQRKKANGEPVQNSTINHAVDIIAGFFSWCVRTERIKQNPCRNFVRLPDDRVFIEPFTADEVARLIAAAEAEESSKKRQRCKQYRSGVYLIMYATGLRISEARRLRWADIDTSTKTIRVGREQKGRKISAIPMNEEAVAYFDRWRRQQRPRSESDNVWPKPPHYGALVRDMAAAGVLEAKGKWHRLRKACSQEMFNQGVSAEHAAGVMRHSDPRLTFGVYQMSRNLPLNKAVARLSPVMGKKNAPKSAGQGEDKPYTDDTLTLQTPDISSRITDARPESACEVKVQAGDGRASLLREKTPTNFPCRRTSGGEGADAGTSRRVSPADLLRTIADFIDQNGGVA